MNKTARFILITAATFVLCAALILLTAYNIGADPFHPRTRHIWALSLVAALYASVRIAMILNKFIEQWTENAEEDAPKTGLLSLFGKKQHAIDRRMEARRERVAAAKAKADDQNTETKPEDGP